MAIRPSDEEEKYFAKVEAEQRAALRTKLEQSARELQEQRMVAKSVGTGDLALAERIQKLGFDHDSARVFDLLPLLHVAWADGNIQQGERSAILDILARRGIPRASHAFLLFESLLEHRPSETFLVESLALLRELVQNDPARGAGLVDLCVSVARASSRLLRLPDVSSAERAELERIAARLGAAAADELHRALGPL